VPYLFISFFQTFGLGLKVMVTSEYLSQTKNSIGKALYNAQSNIALDEILAWSIIIVIFVGISDIIIKRLSKTLEY
jgi:ABC-type nitrate/sulfonate/bicarbonate transport system permease component